MGYCLCDNYTFVHIHFCICTLSGTALPQELVHSNIEQERSDLNHGCVVCATNMQVHVNQKLMEGFLFRLHDLSRRASEARLLLCGFVIDTAHIQMRRQINHQHTN